MIPQSKATNSVTMIGLCLRHSITGHRINGLSLTSGFMFTLTKESRLVFVIPGIGLTRDAVASRGRTKTRLLVRRKKVIHDQGASLFVILIHLSI